MTVAPPLSACLIIILSSLASSEIDVCSDHVTFRLFIYISFPKLYCHMVDNKRKELNKKEVRLRLEPRAFRF